MAGYFQRHGKVYLYAPAFLCALFAAFSLRPLFNDATMWAYEIINTNSFYIDEPHFRFTDFLIQAPVVLALHLFHTHFSSLVYIYIFSFSYALIPLIPLLLACRIGSRLSQPLLEYFPALALYSGLGYTWAYVTGSTVFPATMFWLFLALYRLRQERQKDVNLLLLVSFLFFLFSHETSLLYTLFFCGIYVRDFRRLNIVVIIGIALALLQAYWAVEFNEPAVVTDDGANFLLPPMAAFAFLGLGILNLRFTLRWIGNGLVSFLVILTILSFRNALPVFKYHNTYAEYYLRLAQPILTLIWASLSILLKDKLEENRNGLSLLMGILVTVFVLYDVLVTATWDYSLSQFRARREEGPCYFIQEKSEYTSIRRGGVPLRTCQKLGILLKHDWNIDSLTYCYNKNQPDRNPCDASRGIYGFEGGWRGVKDAPMETYTNGNFNFNKFKELSQAEFDRVKIKN